MDVSETHLVENAEVPPARALNWAQLTFVESIWPVKYILDPPVDGQLLALVPLTVKLTEAQDTPSNSLSST